MADQHKRRSEIALDWVNFLMADVETGVGPFMASYLTSARHFDPAQVGLILGAQNLASVLAQPPAGALVDWFRWKTWLVAGSALVIAGTCFAIVAAPNAGLEIANQVATGIAAALVSPAIAAISLGLVGRAGLARRIGRNETYSHSGNVLTALVAGYLGYKLGQQWIFYLCAALGVLWAATAALIRDEDIDNRVARAAPEDEARQGNVAPIGDLFRNREILIFALTVLLFHIANAAMLPLAGEELSHEKARASSLYMSACIVVSQAVMVPVAFATGRLAGSVGHKPIFLVAFAALTLRGILFAFIHSPIAVVSIQTLDGVGSGISGVLSVLVIANLAKGTGRFNLLQGLIRGALGAGAFLSNWLAGWAAKSWGFPAAFIGLAVVAGAGLALYALGMPETREQ